ncbi:hypothetical protein [Pseudoalteromonas aurantia]|uniref:hypothetical protein n=1 Tax=Pseudoalteromonas aurantia TaxID=43654 RepID=UPI00110B2CDE|nr:hypothetical protein [Pseudoalteromonas aurantia]
MENLAFGDGSELQLSEQSQLQPEHDYSHLDSFTKVSDVGVADDVTESEEMTSEDVSALACYGVSSAADFVESMIEAPVTIDNDTRESIAAKAAPVVAKYCKGGMPPWLVKWKEEIELGLVLGTAALSVYKQIKAHEKVENQSENTEVVEHGN